MENHLIPYNTEVPDIILKEYGRNIQNIVNYIMKIEDREKRSQYAKTLIELMKQINPAMRDAQDMHHKLWDHLYIMSNFKLDVDSPYPKPETSIFDKKPMGVDYNTHNLHFKHYGRNIELLIKKAIELTDKEDQEAAIIYVGKLMKRFYGSWNKENIDDSIIVEHMRMMSKNKLVVDVEKVKAQNLFDSQREQREPRNNNGHSNGHQQHHHRKNNNRKQDNNKRRRS
ncbi:MAG: DUF4290 domain-containing protein [Cytophagaceae bacterium]|nr:DUF4290 domain-containing protein [Cytophagaceae bacterium]